MTQETIDKLIELKFPHRAISYENHNDDYIWNTILSLRFDDIWRELPEFISVGIGETYYVYFLELNKQVICYTVSDSNHITIEIIDNDITEAAAKLWIKLKEEGLI